MENGMARSNVESLRVYRLAEKLADQIWIIVLGWNYFARDTIGKQLVRAVDSIGANISEGSARGTFLDNKRFVKISRGSFHETQYWLRRAYRRQLLTSAQVDQLKPLVDELGPTINAYLKSIGRRTNGAAEPRAIRTDN
jgi:four helix bundle protein